ncbi:MAG: hypothetical protein HY291_10435 [Planctomycetes bacterium]|nr:hypothetical protein [Planctomycetota bacterium]
MSTRTLAVWGALSLALAACAAPRAEEPALGPEQLKQRLDEMFKKMQQQNEMLQAMQKRLIDFDKRTLAVQLLAEEYALRLDRFEKGAAKEFEERMKPEALRRLMRPVAEANVGDWVAYTRIVSAAGGARTEETVKISVAAKGEGKVTLRREITRDGKTSGEEMNYTAPGPYDPLETDPKATREASEKTSENLETAEKTFACVRVTYKSILPAGEGKQGPPSDEIYWINLSVPLTGLVKAEHFAANGDKTTLLLSGYGSGK